MPVGPDPSYASGSAIYLKQQPGGFQINGNTVRSEEVYDSGSLQGIYPGGLASFNSQLLPGKVTFTIAANGANISKVSIQVVDNNGQIVTRTDGGTSTAPTVFDLDIILAQSTGILASLTPSTGLSVVTGTLLNTYTPSANRAIYAQTNATGLVEVNITDTGKQGFFVMVQGGTIPLQQLSRALTSGDYG